MARVAVAVTALASGASTATPAGGTIEPANGATIAAGPGDRTIVRVTNTAAAAHKVTFKRGPTNPPAMRRGLGDLVLTLPEATDVLVVLESARFSKVDGTIDVDFDAGMTGKISAVAIPKAV